MKGALTAFSVDHRRSVLAVGFVASMWCIEPSAIAQTSQGQFPTVTVDLNAVHTIGALDFDVPIRIAGKVGADVNEIALVVSRLAELPPRPTPGETAPKLCDAPTPEIVSTNAWTRVLGLTGEMFSIVIPPLEPNQYYCLTFTIRRSLSAAEQTTFTASATGAIREAFDLPGTENGLTDAAAEKLVSDLGKRIQEIAAPLRVDFRKGSFFDPAMPFASVRSRFVAAERPRLNGQRNAILGQGNVGLIALRQQPPFAAWLAQPTTAQFLRELQNAAATDQDFGRLLEPFQPTITTVLSWQPGDAGRLLAGRTDSGAEPVGVDWTGARTKQRLTALQSTLTTLRTLRDLVSAFIDRPGGTPQTAVSQDVLKALRTSVMMTVDTFVSVEDELEQIDAAIAERERGVQAFITFIEVEATGSSTVFATSVAEFSTRHAQYVSMDLGIGFVPAFEEAFSYVGLNLYLRPVNKQAPLRGWQFKRRFALMGGMTLTGNLAKENERSGLFGERMLVAGVGLRFIDSLRIVGGSMFFLKEDPNPIVTKKDWAWSPFMALSIDWDVRATWERVSGARAPQ